MKKEILNYKLVKPEYGEAARALAQNKGFAWVVYDKREGEILVINHDTARVMKEAEVLDLWFKPVYLGIDTPDLGVKTRGVMIYHILELNKWYKHPDGPIGQYKGNDMGVGWTKKGKYTNKLYMGEAKEWQEIDVESMLRPFVSLSQTA